MAVTCSACGTAAAPDDLFCGSCGASLSRAAATGPRFCTRCGAPVEQGRRFCGRCGAPTSSGEPASEPRAGATAAEAAAAADIDPLQEVDLLADWDEVADLPPPTPGWGPAPDEAPTESIPRQTAVPTESARTETVPAMAGPAPPVSPRASAPPPRAPAPTGGRFPGGAAIALVGSIAVILSSVLFWDGPFRGQVPRDIAARLLLDPDGEASGINLGVFLLALGTLCALACLLEMASPRTALVRRLLGLAALAVPIAFATRTLGGVVEEGVVADLPAALGVGVYTAAVGALLVLFAPAGRRPR